MKVPCHTRSMGNSDMLSLKHQHHQQIQNNCIFGILGNSLLNATHHPHKPMSYPVFETPVHGLVFIIGFMVEANTILQKRPATPKTNN